MKTWDIYLKQKWIHRVFSHDDKCPLEIREVLIESGFEGTIKLVLRRTRTQRGRKFYKTEITTKYRENELRKKEIRS